MMDESRYAEFTLGGNTYKLMLTVRATKDIAKRYGGLDGLSEKLSTASMADQLDDSVWLLTLLANQGIAAENLSDGGKRVPLRCEDIEVLMTPADFADAQAAIGEALQKGSRRYIAVETQETKN